MMIVPLDTVNDMRSMDVAGHSWFEIARTLHLSRYAVAKYADMEDMSLITLLPAESQAGSRGQRAVDRKGPRG